MTNDHVFPQHEKVSFNADGSITSSSYSYPQGGLTPRQYYAGLAMQGMVSGITRFRDDYQDIIINRPRDVAELAIVYADALIEALEKGKAE